MQQAVLLAGLSSDEYSAKSFRPTGATTSIANNIDPKSVQKLGRWETESVFFLTLCTFKITRRLYR